MGKTDSPNPYDGLPGPNEFDKKTHFTTTGKIVYQRKKHIFKLNDAKRIISKLDMTEPEKLDLIKFVGDLTLFDDVQNQLMNWFLEILGTIFPRWFVNLVEWVYNNIDAGIPPWIPEDLQ